MDEVEEVEEAEKGEEQVEKKVEKAEKLWEKRCGRVEVEGGGGGEGA